MTIGPESDNYGENTHTPKPLEEVPTKVMTEAADAVRISGEFRGLNRLEVDALFNQLDELLQEIVIEAGYEQLPGDTFQDRLERRGFIRGVLWSIRFNDQVRKKLEEKYNTEQLEKIYAMADASDEVRLPAIGPRGGQPFDVPFQAPGRPSPHDEDEERDQVQREIPPQ